MRIGTVPRDGGTYSLPPCGGGLERGVVGIELAITVRMRPAGGAGSARACSSGSTSTPTTPRKGEETSSGR